MYQIDVRNLVKNKLFICKDYHIQPSEIEKMPYYEYEYMLEDIRQINKEQEEQNKQHEKEMESTKTAMNPRNMMNNMPKMSSMSLPKVNIPKF